MIGDPVENLHPSLMELLLEETGDTSPSADTAIGPNVPWRPHLLEQNPLRGWYYHFEEPEGDSWVRRALAAKTASPVLKIGVAADEATLLNEGFLLQCVGLDASIAIIEPRRNKYVASSLYGSVTEYICERKVSLSRGAARQLLDKLLERAEAEQDDQRKGVLLEVVCAALMSQVDGFEPNAKGVANRTQQMDVLVHNRNSAGALSGSPVVLVEAKNWPKRKVTPTEYAAFIRKMESRHKRCRLGFIATTGSFTRNVPRDRLRDSKTDELVVLIDGKQLPRVWRGRDSVSTSIERLVLEALVGE